MDSRWKNYDNGMLVFDLSFTIFIVKVDLIWLSFYNYHPEKSKFRSFKYSIFLTHEKQLQYYDSQMNLLIVTILYPLSVNAMLLLYKHYTGLYLLSCFYLEYTNTASLSEFKATKN